MATEETRQTLTCPSCGNVNQFMAEKCIKCGLALGPIRAAMAGAVVSEEAEPVPETTEPKEPAPPMPELQQRPEKEEIGRYVDSWRFLVRGMGDRAEEIAARFFKQLVERDIEGLSLNIGTITIRLERAKQDSRDYYFAERDLGQGALAIMAVRIAPIGTDLFVEWRHYELPPFKGKRPHGDDWLVMAFLVFLWVVPAVLYYRSVMDKQYRSDSLEGFQRQESIAFQLAVRSALEEAIDRAGISKTLIQQLPKEEGEGPRLI